ncbi:unnamed protein product, partial [Ixodes pacificus]
AFKLLFFSIIITLIISNLNTTSRKVVFSSLLPNSASNIACSRHSSQSDENLRYRMQSKMLALSPFT